MSFFFSDYIVVTDIYPGREKPIDGINGKLVADAAKKSGHKFVEYVENRNDIPTFLKDKVKNGDMVVVIGAGDIYHLSPEILKELKK